MPRTLTTAPQAPTVGALVPLRRLGPKTYALARPDESGVELGRIVLIDLINERIRFAHVRCADGVHEVTLHVDQLAAHLHEHADGIAALRLRQIGAAEAVLSEPEITPAVMTSTDEV